MRPKVFRIQATDVLDKTYHADENNRTFLQEGVRCKGISNQAYEESDKVYHQHYAYGCMPVQLYAAGHGICAVK